MNKFWKFRDAVESSDSELILEGVIAQDSWWGDEATPKAFREELNKHSGKLTVVINSPGGDVFAGMAIYNALREFKHEVTVRVDGLAGSIASIVAMAGDKVIMSPGAMMMIHKPWTLAIGDANELDKVKEVLNSIEESMIPIYVSRSGKSTEEVQELLDAETWMTAEQAVELGFADEAIEAKGASAKVSEMFKDAVHGNGQFAFSMSATESSMKSLVAKIKAKSEQPIKEDKMADEKTPSKQVDEAKETKPVAKTEDKEVTEPKSSSNQEPVKEVKMSDDKTPEQEIAAAQVIEPKKQAKQTETPVAQGSYLKSKESVKDYGLLLQSMAGKEASEVSAAWADFLKTKGIQNGITNPDVLLPEPLVRKIEDAFEAGGQIWNALNKTGLSAFKVTRDTVTGEDSRAKGYNRDDEETKAEEVITLEDRDLRPQFIYKYITLPKEVVKQNADTGALVTYVLTELPQRIVREVERAVVIGDGRADDSDYKVSSFLSIREDAEDAPGVFASTFTPLEGEGQYESLIRARALVKAEGAKMLVAKSDFLVDAALQQGVNGGFLFTPGTDLGAVFNFAAGVVTPDWMDDDADNDAYIFTPSAYLTVGDNSIESFTNFLLSTNKNEYLQEIYAGGGLAQLKAAVAIASTDES